MAKLTKDYNLKAFYPEIAKQWHPTKNGDLKPEHYTPHYTAKKVWWLCKKGCEWETIIWVRTVQKSGCPYCKGQKVGYGNDLANQFPNLIEEWDYQKNKELNPQKIHFGSQKKAWWICKAGHRWQTKISSRTRRGTNCRLCSSQTSKPELYIFSELKSIFDIIHHRKKIDKKEIDIIVEDINLAIEYDGVFFHKKRINQDISKKNKIKDFGYRLINIREKPLKKLFKDDIRINKEQELQKTFLTLLSKINELDILGEKHKRLINKYLIEGKPKNISLYKKLLSYLPGPLPGESMSDKFPKLINEWHPTKNGALTPKNMHPGSGEKIWWKCSKNHSWEATIHSRTSNKSNCPYCQGRKVGYGNELSIVRPEIAKEWHPTKNGDLKPEHFTRGSREKIWWKCSKNHSWEMTILNRATQGQNCPYCSGKRAGYGNELSAARPDIAKEWHPTKNGDLKPEHFTRGSKKKVWWLCNKGHSYERMITTRTRSKSNPEKSCPVCYTYSGNPRKNVS